MERKVVEGQQRGGRERGEPDRVKEEQREDAKRQTDCYI